MKPRLPTSKKWTDFPAEYISQIRDVFTKGFEVQLQDCELFVEGRIYPQEILLRVGVLEPGRLAQANFEVSISYSAEKQDAIDRIYNCIDAAAGMMSEYFESDGGAEFPREWKEFDFDNQVLYLRFSTVNTRLEAQADALLGEEAAALVHEDESLDALDLADETIESDEDAGESEELDETEETDDDEDDTDDDEEIPDLHRKPKRREDLH